MGFGGHIAHALARCGFGDQLLEAYGRGKPQFQAFLPGWRNAVNQELQTNSRGHLGRRAPTLRVPNTFPDLDVMEAYANPICSGRSSSQDGGSMRDRGDLNLAQAAAFCEAHFTEWGHRSAIIKRFRDLLWDSAVMTVLRRAALEADEKEKSRRIARGRTDLAIREPLEPSAQDALGTPAALVQQCLSRPALATNHYADIFVNQGTTQEPERAQTPTADPHPLLQEIVGTRTHVSTDYLPQYRVVVDPRQLVDLAQAGIRGTHPEPPEGSQRARKNPPPAPYSEMRLWVPASIVRQVHPGLVAEYEAAQAAKKAGGGTPRRRRGRRPQAAVQDSEDDDTAPGGGSQPTSEGLGHDDTSPVRTIPRDPTPATPHAASTPAVRPARKNVG